MFLIALITFMLGFFGFYLIENPLNPVKQATTPGTSPGTGYPPPAGEKATPKPPVDESKIPDGRYQEKTKIPILTYHYVREMPGEDDKAGQGLSVTPGNFRKQMEWLKEHGYQPIDFNAVRAKDLPAKPVIITFDDGYRDAYDNTFPILQEFGFRGVFYIVTDWIGRDLYLTADQIKLMDTAGMQFGSHTLTHIDMTESDYSSGELKRQLTGSKKRLEDLLVKEVSDFCFPYGTVNNNAIDSVYNAGYKTATSTRSGIVKKGAYFLYLDRVRVHDDSDFTQLGL